MSFKQLISVISFFNIWKYRYYKYITLGLDTKWKIIKRGDNSRFLSANVFKDIKEKYIHNTYFSSKIVNFRYKKIEIETHVSSDCLEKPLFESKNS